MSEQIREQVSAFLDGELPASETELLLKRLTRDVELRDSFGRYALIGESLRGGSGAQLTRDFHARVNRAIDGEPAAAGPQAPRITPLQGWWRPLAGAAVAAGVAAVAVLALQQRAVTPLASEAVRIAGNAQPREALSYTVPAASGDAPVALVPARLTNYVFAHSNFSSGLGQNNVISALLTADEEQDSAAADKRVPKSRDDRVAP